jgi:hypothetical protein
MNTGSAEKLAIDRENPRDLIVRLGDSSQQPTTLVDRQIVAVLEQETPIPLHLLVQRVADELYREELDDGAWVLELGMFGSTLFIPEVFNAIKSGDGIFWQIEKQSQ